MFAPVEFVPRVRNFYPVPPPPKDDDDRSHERNQPLTRESFSGIAAGVSELLKAAETARAEMTAVRVAQGRMSRQIDTLSGHVATLNTDVHNMSASMRRVEADVRDLRDVQGEHAQRIAALEEGSPAPGPRRHTTPNVLVDSTPPPAPRGRLRDSGTWEQTPEERAEYDYEIQKRFEALASQLSAQSAQIEAQATQVASLKKLADEAEAKAKWASEKKAEAEKQATNVRAWLLAVVAILVPLCAFLAFLGPRIWGPSALPAHSKHREIPEVQFEEP